MTYNPFFALYHLHNGEWISWDHSPRPLKFLIVGIDYFKKWIEAEPNAMIKAQQVIKFIWHNIITRFGIPTAIVFDHGV